MFPTFKGKEREGMGNGKEERNGEVDGSLGLSPGDMC